MIGTKIVVGFGMIGNKTVVYLRWHFAHFRRRGGGLDICRCSMIVAKTVVGGSLIGTKTVAYFW